MKRIIAVIVMATVALTILTPPLPAQTSPGLMSTTDLSRPVGAAREYYCFGLGILIGAAAVSANWWFVAGGVWSAYNAGCF
jgi:hypothetical protein